MTHRSPSRHFGAIAAKSLFGLLVFVSTTVAWARFRDDVMNLFPLPGGDGPTGRCAIWFVGSSSIYRWTSLAEDMTPWRVNNRGVNGASVQQVAARLAAGGSGEPPDYVLFYIGENDIAAGATATETARGVKALVATARRRMPHARFVVLGLKPSPTRWSFRPEQLRFNRLARAFATGEQRTGFVDIGDSLLVNGRPGRFYMPDGVHLNADGYRMWGRAVRLAFERTALPADVRRCGGGKQVAA